MPFSLPPSAKPIVKVEASSCLCLESYPCQHNVRLTFKNGELKYALLSGSDVRSLLLDFQLSELPFIEDLEKTDLFARHLGETSSPLKPFSFDHFPSTSGFNKLVEL